MNNDETTTLAHIKDQCRTFVQERNWREFHSPKNLSMNIAAEAAELMEHFLWCTTQNTYEILEKNRSEIEDELADILMAVCAFANACTIDLTRAFEHKLIKTKLKYPADSNSKPRYT